MDSKDATEYIQLNLSYNVSMNVDFDGDVLNTHAIKEIKFHYFVMNLDGDLMDQTQEV